MKRDKFKLKKDVKRLTNKLVECENKYVNRINELYRKLHEFEYGPQRRILIDQIISRNNE